MKITDLRILHMSTPTQAHTNWLFCRIETDAGIHGLGEASLQYKDATLIAELETFKRFLVGQDPFQIEHIWTSLHRRATWSGGPVTMSAISAIDLALWNIVRPPVARQGVGRAGLRAAGRQGARPGARLCQRLAGRGALTREMRLPVATGEQLYTRWEFRALLEQNAVSIIQPDICHAGGISELKKLVAIHRRVLYGDCRPA